jgi:mono/diheme cytochrome c family protein
MAAPRANKTGYNMRTVPASPLLIAFVLSLGGCAGPRADLGSEGGFAAEPIAMQRAGELYGRYCEGCHAGGGALRPALESAGAPYLMHIQARIGMAAVPNAAAETLTHEDARLIVEYLGRPARER